MKVTAEYCIQKLKEAAVLSFATVSEDGSPQIRNISAIHYEGMHIYFLTARGKYFASQLRHDGRIQILGYAGNKEMIRISGTAKETVLEEQKKWRDTIYKEQPYLENVYPGETKSIDTIFQLIDYSIDYFCLGTNPITRMNFAVGNIKLLQKGFHIKETCISCGSCLKACPQKCILPGNPYQIDPSHCLQCGNCQEHCPVKAIERY